MKQSRSLARRVTVYRKPLERGELYMKDSTRLWCVGLGLASFWAQRHHSAGQLAKAGRSTVKRRNAAPPSTPRLPTLCCLSHLLRPGTQAFWRFSPLPFPALPFPSLFWEPPNWPPCPLPAHLHITAARRLSAHGSQILKSSSLTHRRKSLCSNWIVSFFVI